MYSTLSIHHSTLVMGDTTWYNDSIICAAVGITLKSNLKPIRYTPITPKKELSFTAFPNPATNILNIHISEIPNKELRFIVYDMLGKEVYNVLREMNTNSHIIPLSSLNNGVYLLRIIDGKNTIEKKQIQIIR